MRPFGRRRSSPLVEPGMALVMALVMTLACSTSTVAILRELAISITATPATVAVGTPVEFRYDAMGPGLTGIVVTYGDGIADSVATLGATTAGGLLSHTYSAPGTLQVQATVIAENGNRASNSTSVEITP